MKLGWGIAITHPIKADPNQTKMIMPKPKTVEIVRSFSYKLGQPNYSSVDFFCSVRQECELGKEVEISNALHEFSKAEVQKSLASFLRGIADKEKAEWESEREKHNKKAEKAEKKEVAVENVKMDTAQQVKDDIEIVPDKQN